MSRPIHTDSRVLRPIIEALIFASEEPLAPRLLVRLLAGERDDPKNAAGSLEEPASELDAAGNEDGADAPASDDVEAPDQSTGDVATAHALVDDGPSADVARDDDTPVVDIPADEIAAEPSGGVIADELPIEAIPADEIPVDEIGAEETTFPDEAVVDAADEGSRLGDGSESADALATAYVDLSRDYSERLFPEEQIVTIDQRLVRKLIDDLNAEYEETGRAFRIVEVAGGFQFATVREFGEYVALLSKEKQRRRLSPAALETLAIIAFRQPISKPEIESIRGVNSDQVLLSLLEKNLVAITGRSESVGRPLLYGTTEEFLRIFGLNSLNELPKLREIEELMEEDAYSAEKIEVVNVDPLSDAEQIEALVGAAGHEEREEGGGMRAESDGDTEVVDEAAFDAEEIAADLEDLADADEPSSEDLDVELEGDIEDDLDESLEDDRSGDDESALGDRSEYDDADVAGGFTGAGLDEDRGE
jgi:segregation and condensation protein B